MSFRKITIKSGNEESTLEVTKEEYQRYYRPWWQQKKHEQRNREAMEQNGYTEESYEAWRDNASEGVGIPDVELPGVDELVEKSCCSACLRMRWIPSFRKRGSLP